jgi:hypothetical protein
MKWIKRGFLYPFYESEDGVWKIYYDEFGSVACRKLGTTQGWLLGCTEVDDQAIALAEAKIAEAE